MCVTWQSAVPWQELDRLSWELEWDLASLGNLTKACTWVLQSQLLREDRVTVR